MAEVILQRARATALMVCLITCIWQQHDAFKCACNARRMQQWLVLQTYTISDVLHPLVAIMWLTCIDAGVWVVVDVDTVAAIWYQTVWSCCSWPGQGYILTWSSCEHAVVLVSIECLLHTWICAICCGPVLHEPHAPLDWASVLVQLQAHCL